MLFVISFRNISEGETLVLSVRHVNALLTIVVAGLLLFSAKSFAHGSEFSGGIPHVTSTWEKIGVYYNIYQWELRWSGVGVAHSFIFDNRSELWFSYHLYHEDHYATIGAHYGAKYPLSPTSATHWVRVCLRTSTETPCEDYYPQGRYIPSQQCGGGGLN